MLKIVDGMLVTCAILMTGATVYRLFPSAKKEYSSVTEPTALVDGPRLIGNHSAKYRLTIYTDYQCPACRRFEREVDSLLFFHGDSVKVVYHPFPLEEAHPQAFDAAVMADCAMSRGLFQRMHRVLFQAKFGPDRAWIDEVVNAMPATDTEAIWSCFKDSVTVNAVRAEIAIGKKMGINGTPGIVIASRLYIGGRPREKLEELLFHR